MFKHEEINGNGRCPTYLHRWTLFQPRMPKWFWRGFGIYLHKFVGDDWSLDLHDHPKRFWSIGLRGRYIEHRADGTTVTYRAPWIRSFPAEHRHRLTGPTPNDPCWTLVVVGAPVRDWGFWHFERFIPWRHYVAPGSPEAAVSTSCVDK